MRGTEKLPGSVSSGASARNVDIEASSESHLSTKYSATTSVVYWKNYLGRSTVKEKSIESMNQGVDANLMIKDLNDALHHSLGSTERIPYGEISFLQTDFMLDELARLLALQKEAGAEDEELSKIPELHSFIEKGIGRSSKIQNIFDVTKLTSEIIARDVQIPINEARKLRLDLLISSLKTVSERSSGTSLKPLNPIQERLRIDYGEEKLSKLVESATGGTSIREHR